MYVGTLPPWSYFVYRRTRRRLKWRYAEDEALAASFARRDFLRAALLGWIVPLAAAWSSAFARALKLVFAASTSPAVRTPRSSVLSSDRTDFRRRFRRAVWR